MKGLWAIPWLFSSMGGWRHRCHLDLLHGRGADDCTHTAYDYTLRHHTFQCHVCICSHVYIHTTLNTAILSHNYVHLQILQFIHILYLYITYYIHTFFFPRCYFDTRKNAWFQVQRGESIIGSRRRFHRKLQVDGKLIWVIRKGYESYIYIMRVEFLLADSKWIIEYGDSFLFWYE